MPRIVPLRNGTNCKSTSMICRKEMDYYWNKFLERKRQKESYVFEKEIENIMAWKSQLDTITRHRKSIGQHY